MIGQFEIAEKQAHRSRMMWRVGCAVVKRGKVIAKGRNRNYSSPSYLPNRGERFYPTPPGIPNFRFSVHAEWDALRKLDPEDTRGADMFLFGMNIKGNLINTQPCEICQQLLDHYGIRNVYNFRRWHRNNNEM